MLPKNVPAGQAMSHDVTAYFHTVAPHVTSHLKLHEQVVTTLKSLRYHDHASRASTASALHAIQADLNRLAPTMMSVRGPASVAMVGTAQVKAVQHLSAAVGEVAAALQDHSQARARLERARGMAQGAAADVKSAAGALTQATGVAAAAMAGAIPVVGPAIAGALAAVAALTAQIDHVIAASQEGKDQGVGAKERHGSHWPP